MSNRISPAARETEPAAPDWAAAGTPPKVADTTNALVAKRRNGFLPRLEVLL
jgi:hypothetical protein